MMSRRPGSGSERGYSLTELLVVVAMIGMFSLVTVPQFMTFYRQSKVRASVRQFNSHLRAARQRAITLNKTTAISFAPGLTPSAGFQSGQYGIYDKDPVSGVWTRVGNWHRLEQPVYFVASDFDVDDAIVDTLHDVIFQPNGTVPNLPTGGEDPTVELRTTVAVPNNHCTITMQTAGTFTSVLSTD